MISIKLSLDKRWKRTDGTFTIVLRIAYKGKTRDISTGLACSEKDWDSRYNCIKVTTPENKILSKRLNEQRLKYQERLLEFERKLLDPSSDIQTIKEFLAGKSIEGATVIDFWLEEIKRLQLSKQYGNARNYKSALDGVSKEANLNKQFNTIDYNWLLQLESKLRAKGVKTNSISVYMRTLRALYNKAINFGLADQSEYPFRRYRIRSEQTAPRVTTIEELQLFFNHKPLVESKFYDYWNYGKLIFMLRGINFADLAMLTSDNIKHGRLIYVRRKTHKLYSLELLPQVKDILDTYITPERQTLLPILSNEEMNKPQMLPARIAQQTKNCNKWLRRLGKELGIVEQLSTYVFRYSHANACKKLGYSKDIISESLGHSYGLAVSSAYLENYNIDMIDEMNSRVVQEVTKQVLY